MIVERLTEQYSLSMELLLVALGLLMIVVIAYIYIEPAIAGILAIFFIFILWKWEEISV